MLSAPARYIPWLSCHTSWPGRPSNPCSTSEEATQAIAEDDPALPQGSLPGRNLRKIDLADDYQPRLEIVAGVFARKGEWERYANNHPLNLLWNAFTEATPTRPVSTVPPG